MTLTEDEMATFTAHFGRLQAEGLRLGESEEERLCRVAEDGLAAYVTTKGWPPSLWPCADPSDVVAAIREAQR